jgi:hypothetical protein
MAYGQVNADVIGTSVTGSNIGAGNASIMKNRIINGAMVIDQRNAGASVTPANGDYTLDRWRAGLSVASKYSVQQNAGSVTPPIGFSNYLGITSLSAYTVGADDYFIMQQPIEGFNFSDLQYGTANAKTSTISFWVRSSLTGTFGGSFTNSSYDYGYPFTYTISSANTWEQKSVTIAGPTSGTWVGSTNGIGLRLLLGLGVGSNRSFTAGSWQSGNVQAATGATSVVGTNGATFYITGVQLEVGSSATGFEYVNYQTSLANCQRYYWQRNGLASNNKIVATGAVYTSTDVRCCVPCPVTMRTIPTVAFTGSGFGYERPNTSLGTIGTPSSEARTAEAVYLTSGSGTTAGTAGNGTHWFITDGTSNIGVSAEL